MLNAAQYRPKSTPSNKGSAVTLDKTRLRKNTPRIELPTTKTDTGAVRSFMFDYLVPLLAEEFLRQVAGGIELFSLPEGVLQTNPVDRIGLQHAFPVAFEIVPYRCHPKWALPLAA